ncbi:Gastricsin, partial [Eschrichtius robustus]|nr:Gastricsin [Eschrichtius robustus]
NHNKFNPSQSSTFRNNGQTYTLSYDFGSLVVVLVFDTMTAVVSVLLTIVSPSALSHRQHQQTHENEEERFAIGDQATGWCSQGCQAIVDMGTFLLAVSQQYMTSFLQSTGAQQNENGDNNNYCMLGIEASYLPSSSGEPLWILGNVFLKEYYSVFDVANNHVGFALSTLTSARQLPAAACNLPKDSAIALMPLWLRAAF